MKFIVTVDVEADNQWQWSGAISVKNVFALPRFQNLCEKHGFPPTYLVAHEVTQEPRCVEILRRWQDEGGAEIGAHLEPWTTPPFSEEERSNPRIQSFPCELPDDLLGGKLETLTDALEEIFGRRPVSFRAGRWGLDGRVVRHLSRLGYSFDCSVTPKISWKDDAGRPGGPGGPDFRRAPLRPYCLSTDDVCSPGSSGILEVPSTVLHTGFAVREGSPFAKWFSTLPGSLFKKILDRLIFKTRWLRVTSFNTLEDWPRVYLAARRNDLPVIEFIIHSSELMAGGSPFVKDAESLEFIYRHLEAMFGFFRSRGVDGCLLRDYPYESRP